MKHLDLKEQSSLEYLSDSNGDAYALINRLNHEKEALDKLQADINTKFEKIGSTPTRNVVGSMLKYADECLDDLLYFDASKEPYKSAVESIKNARNNQHSVPNENRNELKNLNISIVNQVNTLRNLLKDKKQEISKLEKTAEANEIKRAQDKKEMEQEAERKRQEEERIQKEEAERKRQEEERIQKEEAECKRLKEEIENAFNSLKVKNLKNPICAQMTKVVLDAYKFISSSNTNTTAEFKTWLDEQGSIHLQILTSDVKTLEKDIKEGKNELNDYKQDYNRYKMLCSAFKSVFGEQVTLKSTVNSIESALVSCLSIIRGKEEERIQKEEEAKSELNTLAKNIAELKKSVAGFTKPVEECRKTYETYTDEVKKLKTKYNKITNLEPDFKMIDASLLSCNDLLEKFKRKKEKITKNITLGKKDSKIDIELRTTVALLLKKTIKTLKTVEDLKGLLDDRKKLVRAIFAKGDAVPDLYFKKIPELKEINKKDKVQRRKAKVAIIEELYSNGKDKKGLEALLKASVSKKQSEWIDDEYVKTFSNTLRDSLKYYKKRYSSK